MMRIVSRAVMMAGIAFFLAYVDSYLFSTRLLSTAGTYVFLWALGAWAAVVACQCAASRDKLREVIAVYANHAGVLGAWLAILLCTVVFALLPGAYWNDGVVYLLYPPYDAAIVLLSMLLAVHGMHRQHMPSYLFAALVIMAGSVMYDAWHPGTFSVIPDRAAGFAINPNISGFVLVLLCASIVDFDRFHPSDAAALALTGIAVFLTLSRGGGILFAYEFAYYAYRMVRPNLRTHPVRLLQTTAALAVVTAVIGGAGVFLVERADMFALTYQRFGQMQADSAALLDDNGRLGALQVAWQLVTQSPVIGYGTGYSYSLPLGPHNMYVQQWLNNGVPGLLAYLLLLGAAGRTFWKRGYARGVLFITLVAINGIFSHNILEERAFLCLLGILLTCSFYERYPAMSSDVVRAPADAALF